MRIERWSGRRSREEGREGKGRVIDLLLKRGRGGKQFAGDEDPRKKTPDQQKGGEPAAKGREPGKKEREKEEGKRRLAEDGASGVHRQDDGWGGSAL